jgi:hypothetical protein
MATVVPDSNKPMSKHFMLWNDDKTRTEFLTFFIGYVIWAALDIAFDVLFALESSRIFYLESSDSLPLRHFFPAIVVVLGSSMLLTMFANIPVYHRHVLVSSSQHDEESEGSSKLVLPEFFDSIAGCFRRYLASIVILFNYTFHPPCFNNDTIQLIFSWPCIFGFGLLHLLAVFPVILCNVASFLTLSLTGNFGLFGWVNDELISAHLYNALNNHILLSSKEGLIVDFCDCDATFQGDKGYLTAINTFIMRPIASFFNFKTRRNPAADINVSDPQEAGYFERVTTWWFNYEEAEESPALSFLTYIPLLILITVLPLLQFVASLVVAALFFVAMVSHLVLSPVLIPLGFQSGAFICFCNVVKYFTGAFCIFSKKLAGFQIQKGTTDLSRYASGCRGINCLHSLHVSAFQANTVPRRFKFAMCIAGMVYYPVRGLMLTFTSIVLCSPIASVVSSALLFVAALISFSVNLLAVTMFIACTCICTAVFLIVAASITAWLTISAIAFLGMELLCFVSAMTNPEVGLILYANADERRYKLGAAAGFLEDFPGFILQAYYTHLMGIRGTAGTSRVISLSLSSWRMFVLTVKRFMKLKMMARDRRLEPETPSESWAKEQTILSNSHGVTRKILFNFRSSLFPDPFSAILRFVVFGMYAGFFGWLASQNIYTQSGIAAFLDSNFPVPNLCVEQSAFNICDLNARCSNGICTCKQGFSGDGSTCAQSRPGTCSTSAQQCAYPSTCVDAPGGGFTCPCPLWSTAPPGGSSFTNDSSSRCLCSAPNFPVPCPQKGACVSNTSLSQGEVAAIMIGGVCLPVLLMFRAHWKRKTAGGAEYPRNWNNAWGSFFVAIFSLSLGLMLCLPARINTVTYDGSVYSTVADVAVDGPEGTYGHEDVYLPVPCGWSIAPTNSMVLKVIASHQWSCRGVVLASGKAFYSGSGNPVREYGGGYSSDWLQTDSRGWVRARKHNEYDFFRLQILIIHNSGNSSKT